MYLGLQLINLPTLGGVAGPDAPLSHGRPLPGLLSLPLEVLSCSTCVLYS